VSEKNCECGKLTLKWLQDSVTVDGPGICAGAFAQHIMCTKCGDKIRVGPDISFGENADNEIAQWQLQTTAPTPPLPGARNLDVKKTTRKKSMKNVQKQVLELLDELPEGADEEDDL